MARPKRGNYATGPEGAERYKKALREYLKKTKAAKEKATKITSTKKNISKQKTSGKKSTTKKVKELTQSKTAKTTLKKPVSSKPVSQTATSNKPAVETVKSTTSKRKYTRKKNVAKKPTAKNVNKLRINKAVKSAKGVAKKVVGKGKTVASNIKGNVNKGKKFFDKKSPTKRPTTRLQKLASKGNKFLKSAGKYTKNQVLPKAKKDLLKIGKGIAKDPKSLLKGARGAGITIAADKLLDAGMARVFKKKGETVAQYKKKQEQFRKDTNPINAAKRTIKGIRNVTTGKNWYTDNMTAAEKKLLEQGRGIQATYLKNKKNKNNSSKNNNLKINKKKDNNKNVNPSPKAAEIATVKANIKKASGWNKKQLQKKLNYLEKFGKSKTWQNPVGAKGDGKPSSVDVNKKTKATGSSKWIKTKKGTLARRGSVSARGAENRERARLRAQEMARKRKRKKQQNQ